MSAPLPQTAFEADRSPWVGSLPGRTAGYRGVADAIPANPALAHALPIATRVRDHELTDVLGADRASVTYAARDMSLRRRHAIEEYMPASLAQRGVDGAVVPSPPLQRAFDAGLKAFVEEALLLARLDHPALAKVTRVWDENGTAYRTMPYVVGPTLRGALGERGRVPDEADVRAWLVPLLDAVGVLHEAGSCHFNISPDTIRLTTNGPVLLGFAAASHAIDMTAGTPASALRSGFAAIEQYSGTGMAAGPATDLYALAAVAYSAIIGRAPIAANERLLRDRLAPLESIVGGRYSTSFLRAIDAALAVEPEARPRDHVEFRALMGELDDRSTTAPTDLLDPMLEPFVSAGPAAELASRRLPALVTASKSTETAAPIAATPARAVGATARPRVAAAPPKPPKRGFLLALAGVGSVALVAGSGWALRSPDRPGDLAVHGKVAPSALQARPTPSDSVATPARTASSPAPSVDAQASAAPAFDSDPRAPVPSAPAAQEFTPPAATSKVSTRQARCIEILQTASLSTLSAADTDFYKRECK